MHKIYSIIIFSRAQKTSKRRVKYILKKKLKFYTKEILKFFNITLIAFGFIVAIILIKYKPVYAVSISGEEVGYIQNEQEFNKLVEENIINYDSKNVDQVELEANPEYELKLVNKSEETNESTVLIALQKELKINYKYYDILLDGEKIDSVNTKEDAEQIVNSMKEENEELNFEIAKQTTDNVFEVKTNTLEVAKENITNKLVKKKEIEEKEKGIADVNGIKIANLPVTGTITSRYASVSRLRVSTHTGLDIAAAKGTPIKVVSDGVVTFAGWSGSYGYIVKVDHGNNVETWYAHTSKMLVSKGQEVKAGEKIALVGSTGNSTGPHLHFEIRIDGKTVNPQNYIYK